MLLTRSPLEYPASRAFPFDLHVLSTPPAFVLSQDQTLHKKISEQNSETGREKPETQQKNKPPQTTSTKLEVYAGVQKITTKKNTVPSTRRGQKEETKKVEHNHMPTNPSQCSRNTKQHSKRYAFHIPNRHTPTTPTQGTASTTRHATNPQTKVHWHTIEFSNNTRTITHHQVSTQ